MKVSSELHPWQIRRIRGDKKNSEKLMRRNSENYPNTSANDFHYEEKPFDVRESQFADEIQRFLSKGGIITKFPNEVPIDAFDYLKGANLEDGLEVGTAFAKQVEDLEKIVRC